MGLTKGKYKAHSHHLMAIILNSLDLTSYLRRITSNDLVQSHRNIDKGREDPLSTSATHSPLTSSVCLVLNGNFWPSALKVSPSMRR